MEDETLRQRLQDIAESDYRVPEGESSVSLVGAMLPALGATDPELRERLVYALLHRWIVNGALADGELRTLTLRLVGDEQLFHGIGERETDSVFLRSYSALLLAPILLRQKDRGFLRASDIDKVATALVRYLDEERDLRGYVDTKEWAHGVAHASDAVGQLAGCLPSETAWGEPLARALGRQATTMALVWSHEEDERLAGAALKLVTSDALPITSVERWLLELVPTRHWFLEGELPGSYYRYINTKHFLRCVYFQADEESAPSSGAVSRIAKRALDGLRLSLERRT